MENVALGNIAELKGISNEIAEASASKQENADEQVVADKNGLDNEPLETRQVDNKKKSISQNGIQNRTVNSSPVETVTNDLNELSLSSCPLKVIASDTHESIVSAYCGICYTRYKGESQMAAIIYLITKDLSEPYSIYTYRYFIHNWPKLCFLAIHEDQYVGAIVCKLGIHKNAKRRGYIAMLAVDETVRRKKIGSTLVKLAIEAMVEEGCDEVVLETEVTNSAALHLYEKLGFVRDKRLYRYYLNGVDALRLKLWLT